MYNWRKKKEKNNIDVYKKTSGSADSSDLMAESDIKTNFSPKSIHIEDLDAAFFELVRNGDLKLDIGGNVVPVIIMNSESWAEFSQTWKYTNEDNNILPPFVTVLRDTITEGTYLDIKYTIPNRPSFPYMKVPTFRDGKEGFDLYEISQPIAIDIIYEVRFFSNYMRDTNRFYEKYFTAFSSDQLYINVNGHFMPIIIEEDIQDDLIEDIDSQRLFVKIVSLRLTGYIQDEASFKKFQAMNRTIISMNYK